MLYKKTVLNRYFKNKTAAFSLVEVLMTLLLIALVLISVAPIITKRTASRNIEGVVYTYKGSNVSEDNKCFVTQQNNYSREWVNTDDLGFITTKECSEYEFTVPSGVKFVNLTLVAGGGGGGGAAGGTLQEKTVTSNDANAATGINISEANRDEIRNIKIDYLVGRGQDGFVVTNSDSAENAYQYNLTYYSPKSDFYNSLGKYTGSYDFSQHVQVFTGQGGKSSSAIYNYEVPTDMFRFSHTNVNDNGGTLSNKLDEQLVLNSSNHYYARYSLLQGATPLFQYAATYIINTNGSTTDIACVTEGKNFANFVNGNSRDLNSSTDHNNCGGLIQKSNILSSIIGTNTSNSLGTLGVTSDSIGLNQNYAFGLKKGGEGGVLPIYPNYGKGGRGQGTIANFKGCKTATNAKNDEGEDIAFTQGVGNFDSCESIAGLTKEQQIEKYCTTKKEDLKTNCINAVNSGSLRTALEQYCYDADDPSKPGNNIFNSWYYNCGVENLNGDTGNWSGKKGGPYYGKITYTIERAGGIGGGGSGATYVQIKNLPVTEGETYIVRVGKGGNGGRSGQYGYLNNGINTSTQGQNGVGGVTSSVWRKSGDNETLLYMVVGGSGGQGGKIYTNSAQATGAEPFINNTNVYNNNKGAAGKIVPVVFSDNEISDPNIFGTNKISLLNNNNICSDINFFGGAHLSNIQSSCLNYSDFELNDAYTPHAFLNTNQTTGNVARSQKNLSGFSNFDTQNSEFRIKTINSINYLTSYFYRTLVDDQIGYVGGLGGFSGLGGKAGCGGLFIGNPNGYNGNINSAQYNSNGAKKLFVASNSGNNITWSMSDVSDYYDNCTTDTPNGQSANFVAPSPQRKTLGQAGAGGGGGGYKMFYGGGNGGKGQDGYVMIDWRK